MGTEQRVLAGRYVLLELIGAGGMAEVYRAEDRRLGRSVAVKIPNASHSADSAFVERFRREARAAATLSHPNVVTIYDWGEDEGTYYIVLEYVPGQNLKLTLQQRGRFPEDEALSVGAQVAAALEAAHERGIVHRDVKPHNILLDPNGRARVTDFGIARAAGAAQLTETSAVFGTATYISPEQAEGKPADARSDLYSLGVVLYELLVGQPPFAGETPLSVAVQHVRQPPPALRALRPDLSPAAEAAVLRALQKDPARRYRSAAQMAATLERARASRPRPIFATGAAAAVASQTTRRVGVQELASKPIGRGTLRGARPRLWMLAPPLLAIFLVALATLSLAGTDPGQVASDEQREPSRTTTMSAPPTLVRPPTAGLIAAEPSPTPMPPLLLVLPTASPTPTARPAPTRTATPTSTPTPTPEQPRREDAERDDEPDEDEDSRDEKDKDRGPGRGKPKGKAGGD